MGVDVEQKENNIGVAQERLSWKKKGRHDMETSWKVACLDVNRLQMEERKGWVVIVKVLNEMSTEGYNRFLERIGTIVEMEQYSKTARAISKCDW